MVGWISCCIVDDVFAWASRRYRRVLLMMHTMWWEDVLMTSDCDSLLNVSPTLLHSSLSAVENTLLCVYRWWCALLIARNGTDYHLVLVIMWLIRLFTAIQERLADQENYHISISRSAPLQNTVVGNIDPHCRLFVTMRREFSILLFVTGTV